MSKEGAQTPSKLRANANPFTPTSPESITLKSPTGVNFPLPAASQPQMQQSPSRLRGNASWFVRPTRPYNDAPDDEASADEAPKDRTHGTQSGEALADEALEDKALEDEALANEALEGEVPDGEVPDDEALPAFSTSDIASPQPGDETLSDLFRTYQSVYTWPGSASTRRIPQIA